VVASSPQEVVQRSGEVRKNRGGPDLFVVGCRCDAERV
jgi:hypothetical protein